MMYSIINKSIDNGKLCVKGVVVICLFTDVQISGVISTNDLPLPLGPIKSTELLSPVSAHRFIRSRSCLQTQAHGESL